MFSWFAYRIIADFSQTKLRNFWWAKWQCDRFLSESLEFLLSVIFYRVVNLEVAHSFTVCSYIRNLAHARTVVISLISPLLSACVRAKGVFLMKMALSSRMCGICGNDMCFLQMCHTVQMFNVHSHPRAMDVV